MIAVQAAVPSACNLAAQPLAAGVVSEIVPAGDGRVEESGRERGGDEGWVAAGMQADTGMMARLKAMVPGNLFNKVLSTTRLPVFSSEFQESPPPLAHWRSCIGALQALRPESVRTPANGISNAGAPNSSGPCECLLLH